MIYNSHVVWKNKVATPISQIKVGDKIAVLAEDLSIAQAEVKSIIKLFSTSTVFTLSAGPVIQLATNTTILSPTGFIFPQRGDLVTCGSDAHRVQRAKESLTRKAFYDIMIDVDLPVIFQDGYCIKVRVKK
jgi:hypothetical protein